MKIALIGYGKMGKAIEELALNRNHEICGKFTSKGIDLDVLKTADVAIEFSRPESAEANIRICIENKIPVVIGTTGWMDKLDELSALAQEHQSALLYSSNFSLGVNLFFELNKKLAQLMNPFSDYKIEMTEIHHTEKLDSPSGTAISLAEDIIENLDRKDDWKLNEEQSPSDISIIAERTPEVPGTHTIKYESEIDIIQIEHLAKNRKGFALGAIIAAEFIRSKQGVFQMKDVLKF